MNCRKTREGLTEYLENALPPSPRQGIERHLNRCEACRAWLEQLLHLQRVTREIPPEQMPVAAKSDLLRALRKD